MDREQQRDVSSGLYNNRYMLEVGVAIAAHPKERFTQKDLARAIPLDKNLVATALARLEKATLIERLPREGQSRPYRRVASVVWHQFMSLLRELEDSPNL